ncbi:MAG: gliding motility-associated C-terminal domain-containing protein [Crocinitomicaceae bacterium]|nr:gliding motility-associated C-terminal domain-containing protein [Crocinitomicaceae bacterium]
MEGKDEIKELFSHKLGNYEAKVDPSLWNGIASQLGTTATTVASTGMSLFTKIIIGVSISVVTITTAVILIPNEPVSENIISNSSGSVEEIEKVELREINEKVELKVEEDIIPLDDLTIEENTYSIESSESSEFEMPILVFNEGIIDEDCIGCDLVERNELADKGSSENNKTNSQEANKGDSIPEQSFNKPEIDDEQVRNITTPKPVYYIQQYTNVFTPNGDGINDVFALKIERLENFQIIILDFVTQKQVFESRSTDFTWDGTDRLGNPVKEGNYIYMINALDSDGNPIREIQSLKVGR